MLEIPKDGVGGTDRTMSLQSNSKENKEKKGGLKEV